MENLSISEAWQDTLGLVALGVSPKIEFGGQSQARNAAGLLKWVVQVHSPKLGETFRVGVAAATAPGVVLCRPVKFMSLIVGGSSRGLWWHAAGVAVGGDASPEQASAVPPVPSAKAGGDS